MSSTPFQKAYSSLNENQKKAVDTIDGPVIVMAGPGTGKTQVLTVRIANILTKTDTDPSAILALTFTEAATREMRQRLINLIGKDGYSVRTTTFHAFCSDIINENPERFSRPAGSQAATELEKIEIITKILEDNIFLLLKPLNNPTLYLKDILGAISNLKREGITDKKFTQLVRTLSEDFQAEGPSLKKTAFGEKEKLVQKNLDLLTIYKQYQKELGRRGRFDFEDMINWVVEVFESDEEFLLSYQEKFQYILVDEYQDTNSSQNRLVFALASFWGESANLFAVGDPNQSIFRFQGASQENVKQFDKHFPKSIKIFLTENYRSTQTLLSSAAHLIGGSPLKHNVSHEIHNIKVAKFNSSVFEDEYLIRSIQEKIESGINPSDVAVIVKENKDIAHLADIMKQRNIPYRLEGGVNVLTTPLVSQFIKILRVTTGLSGSLDDLELFTVLNYPYFNLDKFELLKLARLAYTSRRSLLDTISSCHPDRRGGIFSIFNLFVTWNHQAASHTLPEMFQIIFQESGLLNHLLALSQPVSELNRFSTLYEDAKNQVAANPRLDLAGYVKNLSTMEDHGIKLEEQILVSATPSVTLTTAHKAKGLEWLIVYIYRFADTHWGNKSGRQMIKLPDSILDSDLTKEDKNAEERRLFYVALTRAKRELHLSGATTYATSVKMIFPAMFLSDLPPEHLENIKTDAFEKDAVKILANLLTATPEPTVYDGEEAFLKELIANFKLSPTALNTFLQCHYKFKLDNLYRIPRAKAPAMCFGTAVHYALENLYKKLNKTGKLEKMTDFIKDFETALDREVLTQAESKDRLVHGRKILSAYYNHYQKEFTPALFTERNFGYATPILLYDIAISGKSDRIDLIDKKDKNGLPAGRQVRFTDYKTGAPKKSEDYQRQLTFYHLLADLDKSFGYQVTDTVLDFIEPDKTGAFHREHFSITPEEVGVLKDTIKDSVKEIRAMNFERTTDTSICARCDFLSHCWPNGISTNTVE